MIDELPNPWRKLPLEPDYVLPSDREAITDFNRTANQALRLQLDLIPEPFLGNPNAPILVLTLNPGFDEQDRLHHVDPEFIQQSRNNLLHREAEYPLFLLNPRIKAPGGNYWRRKLGYLIGESDVKSVANRVFCVEYFPYHSVNFSHQLLCLASQQYSFALVRRAVGRNARIVVMRGKRFWLSAIPELEGYNHMHMVRSVQNPTITRKNCPSGFDDICEILRS